MTNIWDFLLQTLSVSLTAILLWIVKRIFEDKLSPRWQYGIWSILALRILIPVQSSRYILPKLALWTEALKAMIESGANSAFTEIYAPIRPTHVFPWPDTVPSSVTDYLFLIYIVGIAVFLLRHVPAWIRISLLLKKGETPSPALQERIKGLCRNHSLKPCRIKVIDGLESAFVFGVFRPILAVPDHNVDDKILLHELLHLKYKDIPQGLFWNALRALHWCNPLMHFVFDRIGNDMESLCDQRVLERLEGEERREYGNILLKMANRRYSRAPGTSSISNGGKNIARRIAAIVRFKKYPRGMALVSVCILILLAYPILFGQAATVDQELYTPNNIEQLHRSMAAARTVRCTTPAGAIDTYAKGLLTGNGLYIATVSPLEEHEGLEKKMRKDDGNPFYLSEYSLIGTVVTDYGYIILDLNPQEDGSYDCVLAFRRYEEGGSKTFLVSICVYQEDGWVVRETKEREMVDVECQAIKQFMEYGNPRVFNSNGKYGNLTVWWRSSADIAAQNAQNDASLLWGMNSINNALMPDAEFSNFNMEYKAIYTYSGTKPDKNAFIAVPFDKGRTPFFPDHDLTKTGSGGSGDGALFGCWDNSVDRTICETSGGSGFWNYELNKLPCPEGYAARIYWDDTLMEEFLLEEVQP